MNQGGVSDVTHRKRGLMIFGIWEKAGSWVPASEEEEGWLSEMGEARRLCALRASRVGWVESIDRLCVSLSPHVEKTFKLKKVNKEVGKCCISDSLCPFHTSVYLAM